MPECRRAREPLRAKRRETWGRNCPQLHQALYCWIMRWHVSAAELLGVYKILAAPAAEYLNVGQRSLGFRAWGMERIDQIWLLSGVIPQPIYGQHQRMCTLQLKNGGIIPNGASWHMVCPPLFGWYNIQKLGLERLMIWVMESNNL